MKSILLLVVLSIAGGLPVREWNTANKTPFVFYISGDGGLNGFSADLCKTISNAGYSVTAVDAKSYFWNKRTPEQTAADVAAYLENQFRNRPNQQLILASYSFGSDVMPFIVNRLRADLKEKLISVILLSPSTSTDFEIHLSDMMGIGKKRSMDVVAEINRMNVPKLTAIFGDDENDFPLKAVTLPNFTHETLPGGHRYDNNTTEVARTMMKYFR